MRSLALLADTDLHVRPVCDLFATSIHDLVHQLVCRFVVPKKRMRAVWSRTTFNLAEHTLKSSIVVHDRVATAMLHTDESQKPDQQEHPRKFTTESTKSNRTALVKVLTFSRLTCGVLKHGQSNSIVSALGVQLLKQNKDNAQGRVTASVVTGAGVSAQLLKPSSDWDQVKTSLQRTSPARAVHTNNCVTQCKCWILHTVRYNCCWCSCAEAPRTCTGWQLHLPLLI